MTGPGQRPDYKVYRSRRNPLSGLRAKGDIDSLRSRLGRRKDRGSRGGKPWTPGRVVAWIGVAALVWLLFSLGLFMLSAQLEEGVSDNTERALSSRGNLLTGSNILVIGSDARTGKSIDESQDGPSRADSIMVVHAALGGVRKLSIPRDSFAQIPGHSGQKINAAYSLGGAALTVETVESFLGNGMEINHVIEVDFEDFPALIDALGGITVDVEKRICSPPFDNFWKGLNFKAGEQELDGEKALGFARIRKNTCAPNENDIDRARRQQQVLSGIKGQVASPSTFLRLPLVSWKAPRALKTDMQGPALLALFADMATSGSDDTSVLEPSCLSCGPGGSLVVSDGAKSDAVQKLEG